MLDRLRAVWRAYPARSIAVVTAAVVFVAAKAGVVLESDSVADVLVLVLPILLGGEATHRRVSPAVPVVDKPLVADGVDGKP